MRSIFTFLFLFPLAIQAQDPQFSQFYVNRPQLNPALTALDEGVTLSANYRNQWHRISGGFRTYAVAAELQVPDASALKTGSGFGLGMTLLKDREGAGPLNTFGGSFAFSRHQVLRKDKVSLHLGASAGFVQKWIDFSRLVFSDQLDEVDGVVNPVTGAPLNGIGKSRLFNLEAGAAFRFGHKVLRATAFQSIGLTAKHLIRSTESVAPNGNARLPLRITAHYGSQWPIFTGKNGTKDVFIGVSPQFQAEWQGQISAFTGGANLLFTNLTLGAFFRHSPNTRIEEQPKPAADALIVLAGLEFSGERNVYWVGYSYDAHLRGIDAGAGGGAHEITLRVNFLEAEPPRFLTGKKNTGNSKNKVKCPKAAGRNSRWI